MEWSMAVIILTTDHYTNQPRQMVNTDVSLSMIIQKPRTSKSGPLVQILQADTECCEKLCRIGRNIINIEEDNKSSYLQISQNILLAYIDK